jgi:hypothetical protein
MDKKLTVILAGIFTSPEPVKKLFRERPAGGWASE